MKLSFRKKLTDKTARVIFAVGGISVLFILFLIIFYLFKEVIPIFAGAKVSSSVELVHDGDLAAAMISPEERGVLLLKKDGLVALYSSDYNALKSDPDAPLLRSEQIAQKIDRATFGHNFLVYSIQKQIILRALSFTENSSLTDFTLGAEKKISAVQIPDQLFVQSFDDNGFRLFYTAGNMIYCVSENTEEDLYGNTKVVTKKWEKDFGEVPTGFARSAEGLTLVCGASGRTVEIDDSGSVSELYLGRLTSQFGALAGGRGFVNAGSDGTIEVWSRANVDNVPRYLKIHEIEKAADTYTAVSFSGRNRSFLLTSDRGNADLFYSTTEQHRLKINGTAGSKFILSDKGNLVLSYGSSATLYHLINSHPDVSFGVLFGKVWYENYPAPAYVWQSNGGSDDFEPKYSLVPLFFGTLKGALFALIFAIPLALTGAVFMNQFMHPDYHRKIKPVIEIMAGLPSVIVGFIGGLWLAPLIEHYLPGILFSFIVLPLAIVGTGFIIEKLKSSSDDIYRKEIFLLLPVIVAVIAGSLALTPFINHHLFGGDFKDFLFNSLGTTYDQRNALVVGFAMGFAVIPVIFSLAEDSLSFVPKEIIAGSLALGLSRWQTVSGVVIKAAMSGIISAVMIGFGRAVGETMIVLMATGNTPIMSLLPFNGFRTMSANIAVELPETAVGSTPFRVLFLSALILFIFTFVINIATDVLRSRMKKRLR